MKVSLPASISALVTTWSRVTSVPSSSRSPVPSRIVILTLASASPSASEKPKSDAEKVYGVSTAVVTVLSEAVGSVLVEGAVKVPPMRMRSSVESDDQVPSSAKRRSCESAMLHPVAPSESSPSVWVKRAPKLPLVAWMTTWYVVFAERLRALAGVKVLSPSVFEAGSFSVARLVPGEPDASVKTLTFGL